MKTKFINKFEMLLEDQGQYYLINILDRDKLTPVKLFFAQISVRSNNKIIILYTDNVEGKTVSEMDKCPPYVCREWFIGAYKRYKIQKDQQIAIDNMWHENIQQDTWKEDDFYG